MSSNPYVWINESAKLTLFIILIALTIILTIVLTSIGKPLKNSIAPQGIISFEVAGSEAKAKQIINSWTEADRQEAFLSLGVDYLYLFLYPFAISLACHLLATKVKSPASGLSRVGDILSWLVLLAIPLDGTENYALVRVLRSLGNDDWTALAKWCALPKFGLVIIGIGYVLTSLIVKVLIGIRQGSKAKTI